MRKAINSIMRRYLAIRYERMKKFMYHPHDTQKDVLLRLVQTTKNTEWGATHGFSDIRSKRDFANQVSVQDYESLKPYITRMMYGEKNVLWNGQVKWYSKSSGTTSEKSKFIPVTNRNLVTCHIQGNWDTIAILYHNVPTARVFLEKSLVLSGSLNRFHGNPLTQIGDISAILTHRMPAIGRPFYAPDFKTALMHDWEAKINRTVELTKDDPRIYMLGGVPTWIIVLFRRLMEATGKDNMLDIWPNLSVYIHGGVGFEPYREQFKRFIPSDDFTYMEAYNASEGFFAAQLNPDQHDMLLLLDNGIYYEFLPMEEWDKDYPQAIPLEAVEIGKNYAMIISTNAGLWRYNLGDTVMFTSTSPYKIKVTGRTKQFVNAFGEEVMVDNTDQAVTKTCRELNAIVTEYTVGPVYFSHTGKGGHEWIMEFEKRPENASLFAQRLDENLQKLNSDYEAKRFGNMALEQLQLHDVPKDTFHNWMRQRGKFGVQNKIPRLANHRQFLEEILEMVA